MYVNTTNVDLNLSQGAVAQALSKAAGPALQAECTKKAPISVGDIAVTGSGRLPCRYVLHTVAAQHHRREKQAEKVRINYLVDLKLSKLSYYISVASGATDVGKQVPEGVY